MSSDRRAAIDEIFTEDCVFHESAIRKLQTHFYDYGGRGYRTPVSKCSGRPLGLCGQWLPELNLVPIQIIDPGKATVGFIHSFGVNLYSLLF